ncbi:MAG: sulfite exporter TauE/SafE family protein [Flavobacteriales bacterium]|nr:sulfite exporter TauE/SafE family protein [Flavobacteriales bacterium]
MNWEYLLLFITLALIAEILGTLGGFGSSMLFVPMAGYFLDFHSVLGITALFHVSSNLTKIVLFRKGFDKQLILFLGVPAVVFVIVGAWMSKWVDPAGLKIGLAFFLIVSSVLFLRYPTIRVQANVRNSIAGGVLSGGIAGVIGTGGAIRGITLAAFDLRPDVFIATSAIIDMGVDSSRTVVYWMNGYIHQHDLYLVPFLIAASIAGTYTGKVILKRVSQEKFKRFVLVLVLLTGLLTLADTIRG